MQVIFIFISAIAFILYGLLILVTDHMKIEFRRYGLSQFRMLTGALELLGGAGLLLGFYYLPLLILSAGGLALLMLLGVIVRLKTRDPLDEIIPAFILMLMNIAILFSA
jgi:hypothetical protein